MATAYQPFGGKRTFMNEYEQADIRQREANTQRQQSAALAAMQAQQQANMLEAQMQQQTNERLGRQDFSRDLRDTSIDYQKWNQGGRDLHNAETAMAQQIADARAERLPAALASLPGADDPAMRDAMIGLITGVDPSRNRLAREQLEFDRSMAERAMAAEESRAASMSEENKRKLRAEYLQQMAQVYASQGNVMAAQEAMREAQAVIEGDVKGMSPALSALPDLPKPEGVAAVQGIQQVVNTVRGLESIKEGLVYEIAQQVISPTSMGDVNNPNLMRIEEMAVNAGLDPAETVNAVIRSLVKDSKYKERIADIISESRSGAGIGNLNPLVAMVEGGLDRSAALKAIDNAIGIK